MHNKSKDNSDSSLLLSPVEKANSSHSSKSNSPTPSPLLVVCTSYRNSPDELNRGEDDSVSVELPVLSSQTPLSATHAHRRSSPLAWSTLDDTPSSFIFSPIAPVASFESSEPILTEVTSIDDRSEGTEARLHSPNSANDNTNVDSPTSTETSSSISAESDSSVASSAVVCAPRRVESSLAPTATPFTFKPNPDAKAFVPPVTTQTSTTQLGSLALLDPAPFVPATVSAGGSVAGSFGAGMNGRAGGVLFEHRFDERGHLVGGGATYQIADEILALQSTAARPFPPSRSQTFSGSSEAPFAPQFEQPQRDDLWQGRVPGYGGVGYVPSHALPPTPPHSIRERSSSLGSAHSSHWNVKAHSGFVDVGAAQRAQEQAALQSYFGPSSVEVNPPPGSFSQPVGNYSDINNSNGGYSSPSPRNLPDVSDESPLYLAARDAFVGTSVRSYSPAEAAAAASTFITHFDRAMKSAYPLAALYSISKEKAAELAANPSSSGVDELVLRVAARRMGLRSAEVGGPSANNRKLGLYKTELCRSWEEKGSCRYGAKCQFAHGESEKRPVARHPKFKSEVCRTFLTSGICPYGARCVFKHSTEVNPGDSLSSSMGSINLNQFNNAGSASDDPALRVSRLGLRTSTQPISNATFGPALATYLGPDSSPSSSLPGSPAVDRFRSLESSVPFPSAEPRKLSVTVAPGEVPPQWADPPQSRLHRLSQISSGGSNASIGSSNSTLGGGVSGGLRSRASFDSFGGVQPLNASPQRHSIGAHSLSRQTSFTNPFNPAAGTAMSSTSTVTTVTPRHGSTSSFGSFASSSGYASSFLPRKASSSSLSSFTESNHGLGTLQAAGSEWFTKGGSSTEWTAPAEDDTFADFSPLPSGLGLEQDTITPARSLLHFEHFGPLSA